MTTPLSNRCIGNAQRLSDAVSEIEILRFRLRIIAPVKFVEPLRTRFSVPTGCVDSGVAGYSTTIRVRQNCPDQNLYQIECDNVTLHTVQCANVVRYLEWAIHSIAVARLGRRYLLLHAGAVAYRGSGIILCAGSGSGKSTLTAGLVAAGFEYLSDEVATIDPSSLLMHPYPRSICVKDGSRPTLEPLYHELVRSSPQFRFGGKPVWFLQPRLDLWCTEAVPVRYIVFPTYAKDALTELTEISRSSAVQRIVNQSFTGNALGDRSIGTIVRLLQAADCFTLTVGSLSDAVTMLSQLVRD